MIRLKKLMSFVLTLCMVVTFMPTIAWAGVVLTPQTLTVGTNGTYTTLTEAIAAAGDGDTIILLNDITESVSYTVLTDKNITIDGQGHKVTGVNIIDSPFALLLSGAGDIILKNLILKGSDVGQVYLPSAGLYVYGSVDVLCEGTVTAIGGISPLRESSGVVHNGTGVVNLTNAIGGINSVESYGAKNAEGTLNVTNATGLAATKISYGVTNNSGILNVKKATSGVATDMSRGVWNNTGTVNVTQAEGGVTGEGQGVVNNTTTGKVNAGTVIGGTQGTVNTAVAQLKLNKGTDADCVLDYVTVAASGSTNVGILPKAIRTDGVTSEWYTSGSRSTAFTATTVTGATTLYSTFVDQLTVGTGGDYSTLAAALIDARGADTTILLNDITESVTYTVLADKTITIDGQGHKITCTTTTITNVNDAGTNVVIQSSFALMLNGAGSINLKDITLQAGTATGSNSSSIGLFVMDTVNVKSDGEVNAYGGTANKSYGLFNFSAGTVNLTSATGIDCGVHNETSGTVNVAFATGTGSGSEGVYNSDSGTVNVTTATGVLYGAYNDSSSTGTINVNSASGTGAGGTGVSNQFKGTINVTRAEGSSFGAASGSSGWINVSEVIGSTVGQVNTGSAVDTLLLYKGAGAYCVLDSITVAKTGTTTIGALSSVIKNGVIGVWYTDSAKTQAFSGTTVAGVTALYSSFSSTVTFDKNGGDTQASPIKKTGLSNGSIGSLPTAPTKSGYTFSGWNTAANGSGTVFTATTEVMTNVTVYAQWTLIPTGGSGGSIGGTVVVPTPLAPPAATITETPPTGNVQGSVTSTIGTEATSDLNGKASAAVTVGQITEAVKQATDAAAKKGEDTLAKVEIKVTAPTGATSVETSIPHAAFKAVVDSSTSALTVSTPLAALTFDEKALSTISKEAKGDIKVTASKVDASTLSEEIKQEIGDRPVFNFSVTSGDETISQFGGNVTVAVPYTPKAGEDINAIVIYYINAQGRLEMVSNCSYDPAKGSMTFTTNHFSKYAVGYNKVTFKDVATNAWYGKAVEFVAARGITVGAGEGIFSPDNTLTRGQFLVMAMRAYGIQPLQNPKDNFADAGNTYYTGYLATGKSLGITGGIGKNQYAPEAEITRQEMFALLYKILMFEGQLPAGTTDQKLTTFSDRVKIEPWAMDAMTLFVKTGVINGSNGKLTPTDTTNRAQMAQVFYNLLTQ